MNIPPNALDANGLKRFVELQRDAVNAVTERFYATRGSSYERFGSRGRDACRQDLAFHLEFLRPVLEFGQLEPMVDYLSWLSSVLAARGIPVAHLSLSIDWLSEFFAERMNGADASVVTSALLEVQRTFLKSGAAPSLVPLMPPEQWPETPALLTALLAGDHRDALAIINKCIDRGDGLVEIELHVIQSALHQIGERWQANQVSVAQEHIATAIAHSIMTAALLRTTLPAAINKRVLLACVEGNNHAVGLRMVADAFLLDGWDVQFLGANVPVAPLVDQVVAWKPDLVGLSVSFAQQLRVAKEVIERLHARLGAAQPPVLIGGLAINRFSRLAHMIGADACGEDASSALICAKQLVNPLKHLHAMV